MPTYGKVRYREIYPGVDLVYYGNQGKIEHDFIVSPGADPGVIELAIEGAEDLRIDNGGNVLIGVPGGNVTLRAPAVCQEGRGHREAVPGKYVIREEGHLGFEVAAEAGETLSR